jgi:hypothetical protein
MGALEDVRVWPHWNLAGVEQEHGLGNTDADGCSWCKCERPADECSTCVALAEVERLRGVVESMEQENAAWREVGRVLRDQSVIVAEDGAVFEQIAKWANAPSNTVLAALEAKP